MKTTTTIRQTVEYNIENHLADALRKAHEFNYETLYVNREGEMWWSEEASSDTRIIDREADAFAAIPSLIQVGTGSIRCNCDWCSGPNADEIEFEGAEYDAFRDRMTEALEAIPVGYFRDEDTPTTTCAGCGSSVESDEIEPVTSPVGVLDLCHRCNRRYHGYRADHHTFTLADFRADCAE